MKNIGKYQVIKELGQGATATVYLCQDGERQVAVKYVDFQQGSVAMRRRLRKLLKVEKAMGERLNHPNIVKIFDAELNDNHAFLVMEYVDGCSLEDFCEFTNLLPLHRSVEIIFKCAMALDHAFRQGVIHRDIKPANILLDSKLNPKIADFGLSEYLNKNSDNDSTFIMGAGSPAYMSPEQIKGYQVNQKSDIYSLGVVLFQLLTGRLPFMANNQAALTYKIVNMSPPSVNLINPNVPEKFNSIINKALQKDMYGRYKDGADFAKDLSAVRYKIVDEYEESSVYNEYFSKIRTLPNFTEFDSNELWELLRISRWQKYSAETHLASENQVSSIFAYLVEGQIEASYDGKVCFTLASGSHLGEYNFLLDDQQAISPYTYVCCSEVTILEIRSAALSIVSDELKNRLIVSITKANFERLLEQREQLTVSGKKALVGKKTKNIASSELKLVE